jgi:tRNA1(Val) A37 N6-methylase TrmN6
VSTFSEDGFLNNRLRIRQPRKGFRAGLDAVMLAAAVPAGTREAALELGAGVGTASLCLAARTDCMVAGIEIEAELVELANQNADINNLAAHAGFEVGDVLKADEMKFTHVFTNPPFHDDTGQRSPNAQRAQALHDAGSLKDWVRIGVDHVASKGSFTIILRADRLDEVLAAMPGTGACIFPLLPRVGETPKRIIVQWREGRHDPHLRLEGLVLHQPDGRYTPGADAILRDAAPLRIAP